LISNPPQCGQKFASGKTSSKSDVFDSDRGWAEGMACIPGNKWKFLKIGNAPILGNLHM